MTPTLHIVTQCTDRKKVAVPSSLRLRAFHQAEMEARAAAWTRALHAWPQKTPAQDLYAGEHWTASVDVQRTAHARGVDARLWVLSAGYGLLPSDTDVAPYAATFVSGNPDSVVRGPISGLEQRQSWLVALARAKDSLHRVLSRVGEVGRDIFLVTLSRPYLQAVLPELQDLRGALRSSDQLAIVTAECPELSTPLWTPHWIPSVGRLRSIVGGTMIGLHARLGRRLVADTPPKNFGASAWREQVESWLKAAPQVESSHRQPMNDEEVREFIRRGGANSWSVALRQLRGSGRACEQGRFRKLFLEVRAS